MNYQKFLDELPALYENWGQNSVQPKSPQFQAVLDQIQGMTTANVMQLLNFAVSCMEENEIYCEIGTYQGSTLIGALLNHPTCMAYGVDNFSEYDPLGENLDKLSENLSKFNLQDQVIFCNQDFEEFLLDLREINLEEKIGVYLYDGAHDYRSQLLGLLLIRPFLSDRALIIVDDNNWGTVRQAIWDFIAANPECQSLLELFTPIARYPSFWNGIHILSWDRTRQTDYTWATFQQVRQPAVIEAIYNLQMLEQKEETLLTVYKEAVLLHEQQRFYEAEQKYRQFLLWRSQDAQAWLNLGILYYEMGQYQEAARTVIQAVELNPSEANGHHQLGLIFEALQAKDRAIAAYRETIALAPGAVEASQKLAQLLIERHQLAEAEAVYRQAIAVTPENSVIYLELASLLLEQADFEAAIATYQSALSLNPDHLELQQQLQQAIQLQQHPVPFLLETGNRLYQQGRYQSAIERYQKLLNVQSGTVEVYFNLSECLKHLGQTEAAIATLQTGIQIYPQAGSLYFQWVMLLRQVGQTQAAIAVAETAAQVLPQDYTFQLLQNLLVPIVYDTEAEIALYRQRFSQGLQTLTEQTQLLTGAEARSALEGLKHFTNFYLTYQAQNDVDLQKQYGQLVHRIMAANYPDWVKPLPMPALSEDGKIRVGYLSAYLHSYSGTLWLTGWLRNCDRQQIEIYCYYTGNQADAVTEKFREYSQVFRPIPGGLEAVCQQVLADRLHILVFPEIGMDPQTLQIAALRLAPVCCTAWGHPTTSGLPTVDYYLSSELMESAEAQAHYTETLIRLPNLAISYPKPVIPELTKTRSDFGLREEAIVYLCCQAPFKYLPQHDFLFVEIAQQVPQAQFVFIRADTLQARLQRAFAAFGLEMERHCLFLPVQARNDYLMLNLISDVYLDSIGFTGGNTSLDAIACHLPIVTCPTQLMRGRLSYAMLTLLGITETIAETEAQYVAIAVRLGQDKQWRHQIASQMEQHGDRVFEDQACVLALEAFYRQVVQESINA